MQNYGLRSAIKYLSLVFAMTLSALLLGAICSSAQAEPKVVKVGVGIPLSGSLAHVGVDIRRGMELAIEDVDSQKVKFELIFEDNAHQPTTTATVAQKLTGQDKVDVIVSLWDMADVVAPIAERRKTTHFCIRWNPHLAEKYNYTVTFESTYLNYAKSQIELLKKEGVKTLGFLTEETQGWILSAGAAAKFGKDAGMEILGEERFGGSELDYRSLVTRIVAKSPDVIVVSAYQPHLDNLVKRIREQRPTQRVTGFFEAIDNLELVEGWPFVAQYTPQPWFVEKFKGKYAENFKARAPHGYDLIRILEDIYSKSDAKPSADEVVARLTALKNFPGATGSLSANNSRTIENVCVWSIIRNGKIEELK